MTQTIKRVLRQTRVLDLINSVTSRDRVEILLYHGFCEGSERDWRFPKLMPITEFEDQVRLLLRYRPPLRLEELPANPRSGIVVTIDDGYANNYRLAFPVLRKYQCPATVFLTTGFIDRTTPLWSDWLEFLVMAAQGKPGVFEYKGEPVMLKVSSPHDIAQTIRDLKQRLRRMAIGEIHDFLRGLETHLQARYSWDAIPEMLPLTWDEVRDMQRSGVVSFGSHTVSHPVLSRCTAAEQRRELADSKRRVEEETGERCLTIAYPYGTVSDYTERTKQIARELGYRIAVTTEGGYNALSHCDWHELRRWGADINGDELSFLMSGGPVISQHIGRRLHA